MCLRKIHSADLESQIAAKTAECERLRGAARVMLDLERIRPGDRVAMGTPLPKLEQCQCLGCIGLRNALDATGDGWIPVSERLPIAKKDSECLIHNMYAYVPSIGVFRVALLPVGTTHWRPIRVPPPPDRDEQERETMDDNLNALEV